MQKLENKHIRLIYFLNGWIWWIIRGPVPRWQLVRTPVKLLGRLARTCARSGGDGRWQLSLKEGVNNIRGWLRDALSKSNLSVDHSKKHRANSINHSSTFAYFFLSVSLHYTLFILINYHTGITSIIPYLWLLHNRIYYWCLIWYILLIQDNTDANDMTWPKSDLAGSWVLVLVLGPLGPGPGPWVLILWEYCQDQDPGPDFSQIWQNNSSSKMTKNLCNIDWIQKFRVYSMATPNSV